MPFRKCGKTNRRVEPFVICLAVQLIKPQGNSYKDPYKAPSVFLTTKKTGLWRKKEKKEWTKEGRSLPKE